jgi:molybdate transport system regulatory protein
LSKKALNLEQALGSEMTDKRLDILRRVGEVGSISEAARAAGVSYKAAWQALETLSNLAGTPMVSKAVGGTGGGGAEVTPAGWRVLAGASLLAQAKHKVLEQLKQSDEAVVSTSSLTALGLRTSMRNHLPCQVASMKKSESMIKVALDLGDGQLLHSRITQESAELLQLRKGMSVLALFKATAVQIKRIHEATPQANLLEGKVTRRSNGLRGGEISLELGSGSHVVGFSDQDPDLSVNATAQAKIEESSVVIALLD